MDCSDWVLIVTTLFLGVIAIWGDRIKLVFFHPQPKVTFKKIAPYCHKTLYINSEHAIREPVYFFRFMLENIGTAKLNNCQAILEQLWIFDSSGKPQKYSSWTDITLVWAGGRLENISLDPQRRGFCNIGHVASENHQNHNELFIDIPGNHEKGLRFVFETNSIPYSQPNCLLPGRFAIKIMLYAENGSPIELWFEIAWSGKWQDSEPEMFRELTINQIDKLE